MAILVKKVKNNNVSTSAVLALNRLIKSMKNLMGKYGDDLSNLLVEAISSSDRLGAYTFKGKPGMASEGKAVNQFFYADTLEFKGIVTQAFRSVYGKSKPEKAVFAAIAAYAETTLLDNQEIEVSVYSAYLDGDASSGVLLFTDDEDGKALLMRNGAVKYIDQATGHTSEYNPRIGQMEYTGQQITTEEFSEFRSLFSNFTDMQFHVSLCYLGFILAFPRTEGLTIPICFIHGEASTGKTTVARMFSKILGMKKASVKAMPTDIKSLVASAAHDFQLIFDNAGVISNVISDALCSLSTGGTVSDRKLHTNVGLCETTLHQAVVITLINTMKQTDANSRGIFLHASQPKVQFSDDLEMYQKLETLLPAIQSWLLDFTAKAMSNFGKSKVVFNHRAKSFMAFVAAYEYTAGIPDNEVQLSIKKSFDEAVKLSASSHDPILTSIVDAVHELKELKGTPADLFKALMHHIEVLEGSKPKNAPGNANALSAKLGSNKSFLLSNGISFENDLKKDSKGRRQWHIKLVDPNAKRALAKPSTMKQGSNLNFMIDCLKSDNLTNDSVNATDEQSDLEELILDEEATAEYEAEQQTKFKTIENQPEYHDPELQAMLSDIDIGIQH